MTTGWFWCDGSHKPLLTNTLHFVDEYCLSYQRCFNSIIFFFYGRWWASDYVTRSLTNSVCVRTLGYICIFELTYIRSSSELLNRIKHGFLHNVALHHRFKFSLWIIYSKVWGSESGCRSFWDTLYNQYSSHFLLFNLQDVGEHHSDSSVKGPATDPGSQ